MTSASCYCAQKIKDDELTSINDFAEKVFAS